MAKCQNRYCGDPIACHEDPPLCERCAIELCENCAPLCDWCRAAIEEDFELELTPAEERARLYLERVARQTADGGDS
jgi:hypothetical protein